MELKEETTVVLSTFEAKYIVLASAVTKNYKRN